MRLCIVMLPTARSLYMLLLSIESLNQVALYGRVLPSELKLRMVDLTPSMPWMVITSTSYLDFSCSKVCRSTISSKSFDVVFRYHAFLLNSLKFDDINKGLCELVQ
jgi:hypothetical protein